MLIFHYIIENKQGVIINMSSKATIDFRRRRKINLIKVCGNCCNLCGYNKTINALEFHHIDPKEKKYGISSQGICHSLEEDLQEIKKCILVCSNCHREIHDNLYTQKQLIEKKQYNDQIEKELIEQRNQVFKKTKFFCKNCQKELSQKTISGLCSNCISLKKRVVKRPSREELKFLIRTKPFTQIGKQFNVSDNAIRKWCENYNLPKKVSEIKKISDENWVKI